MSSYWKETAQINTVKTNLKTYIPFNNVIYFVVATTYINDGTPVCEVTPVIIQ